MDKLRILFMFLIYQMWLSCARLWHMEQDHSEEFMTFRIQEYNQKIDDMISENPKVGWANLKMTHTWAPRLSAIDQGYVLQNRIAHNFSCVTRKIQGEGWTLSTWHALHETILFLCAIHNIVLEPEKEKCNLMQNFEQVYSHMTRRTWQDAARAPD